jgi:hypothetical protein
MTYAKYRHSNAMIEEREQKLEKWFLREKIKSSLHQCAKN